MDQSGKRQGHDIYLNMLIVWFFQTMSLSVWLAERA